MTNHIFFTLLIILGLSIAPISAQSQKKRKKSKKDYLITISTSFGDILMILYDDTPKHKENFLKLTKEGFYNGTTFHRVMKNFMIQGGDPNTKAEGDKSKIGGGGAGYTIEAEFQPKYTHKKGALAAARQGDHVNPEKRSGSQFYIVHSSKGAHHLDGAYTVFGEVIQGIGVVDKIAEQPVDHHLRNRPKEDIPMTISSQLIKKKKINKLYGYVFGAY